MGRISPKSDSYEALLWDVVTNAHRYRPTQGDRVLDLGAHFGVFSLFCAARGCEVHAYEPASFAYSELLHTREVAEEIGEGSIRPFNRAIWSEYRQMALGLCAATTGSNSLMRFNASRDAEFVTAIPLKDAMSACAEWSCVKFDIEGAEHEVLKAADPKDLARIKFLTLELHNDILTRDYCAEVDSILRGNFPGILTLPVKVQGQATDQVSAYYCWR